MTDRLRALAAEFNDLREESAYLRKRLAKVGPRLTELRPLMAEAIADAARAGETEAEIAESSGYTRERVRQILRDGGIEAAE